ncbi:hypothetical protein BMS3Abin10_00331 [bacterium BMS3Abin10]|nr:hypothetical protein BMS3Abin10_00331 [bacterium BMS3Abin10]GBE40120.1 hypothetical protein BMS3Bbin08_02758 [bacterium BMS3Bbin08]
MNEVRRFLRYTLPGIACVIQLLIALSISDLDVVSKLWNDEGAAKGIALVFGAFIASGGLGYVFSIIYFALYWDDSIADKVAIDHRTLLESLQNYVELKCSTGEIIKAESLSKRQAWSIITQYWHSKTAKNKSIKGLNSITDRLVDVTHGIGTTIVGTFIAFATWLLLLFFISSNSLNLKTFYICLTWFVLLSMMYFNYKRSLEALQSIANSTLTQVIMEDYERIKPEKVTIWFSE